jgi:hypothetical protein
VLWGRLFPQQGGGEEDKAEEVIAVSMGMGVS